MTIVVVIISAFFLCLAIDYGHRKHTTSLLKETEILWLLIHDLEADKRSLTESLCRAEGKPFISVRHAERQVSEGWFDAKPHIKIGSS